MSVTYTKIDKAGEQNNLVIDSNYIINTLRYTDTIDRLYFKDFLSDKSMSGGYGKSGQEFKKGVIKDFNRNNYNDINNTLVVEKTTSPNNQLQTWGDVFMVNGCYVKAKYNTTGNIKVCNTTTGISDIIREVNGRISVSTTLSYVGNEYVYFFLSGSTVPNDLFSGISTLTEISFSANIETIGSNCCCYCKNLSSVTYEGMLGGAPTNIQTRAFHLCDNIQRINFESEYNLHLYYSGCTIGGNADVFGTNSDGADLYVNGSLVNHLVLIHSTQASTFKNCKSITDVVMAESTKETTITIGDRTFVSCKNLNSVHFVLYNGQNIILGNYAFMNCTSLTDINEMPNVTSIGTYCFEECTSLNECTLYSGLTSIGDYAFKDTDIQNLKISGFTGTIGFAAFENTHLSYIYCSGTTAPTFNTNAFLYLSPLLGGRREFIFSNNTLRDSYINNKWLCDSGSLSGSTIRGYNILTAYFVGNGSSVKTSQDSSFISTLNGGTPYYMDDWNYKTVYDCMVLTSGATSFSNSVSGRTYKMKLFVPSGLTTLVGSTFYNVTGLTSINFSDTKITNFSARSFYGCNRLTNVVLPSSTLSIGERAFYNCSSLSTITSYATTVPTIASIDTFNNVAYGGTLYVPSASASSYRSTWLSTSPYYLGYYSWNLSYV